jgi:hypothetical protein
MWFRIGCSVVPLFVNGRDMAVFSKGKGGRSSKLKNIGNGVCAVHKLRKLHTKYEMLQVRCNINFIIQVSEVAYVSVLCVMK